jgi:hypothetical protein
MEHAKKVCSTRNLHTTAWLKSIGRATHGIIYWDVRIKRGGARDTNDAILKYYMEWSNVDTEEFDKVLAMSE